MRAEISCKMSVLLPSETVWSLSYDLLCDCGNDPPLPQPRRSSLLRLPAAPLLESTPLCSSLLNVPGHGNLDAFHIRAKMGPKFLIYGFLNKK